MMYTLCSRFFKKITFVFALTIYLSCTSQMKPHFITNKWNKRFGNNIITYAKAKWISQEYGFPFVYTPFKYSEQLQLDKLEKKYDKDDFEQTTRIMNDETLLKQSNVATLYITEEKFSSKKGGGFWSVYDTTIKKPEFKKELLNMIQPVDKITDFKFPDNMVSVAVHVRKGGGYDPPLFSIQQYTGHEHMVSYSELYRKTPKTKTNPPSPAKESSNSKDNPPKCTFKKKKEPNYIDKQFPSKFPPDQFYIDQIKKISEILNNAPLFVYIFTDDLEPKKIVTAYKKTLKKRNITFACRGKNNNHYSNVLEDFFTMAQFDCLIRPNSSYSQAAQLIGNHKIIMYPKNTTWLDDKLIVNKVRIVHRKR